MNYKHFILMAFASFLSSLAPLMSSGDENEVKAFLLITLLALAAILLLLALTRKYWKGARSVK